MSRVIHIVPFFRLSAFVLPSALSCVVASGMAKVILLVVVVWASVMAVSAFLADDRGGPG